MTKGRIQPGIIFVERLASKLAVWHPGGRHGWLSRIQSLTLMGYYTGASVTPL